MTPYSSARKSLRLRVLATSDELRLLMQPSEGMTGFQFKYLRGYSVRDLYAFADACAVTTCPDQRSAVFAVSTLMQSCARECHSAISFL